MSKWSAWPCDEIKDLSEIRQRHARDEASSSLWERNPYVMHRDREWLLSEVKRQGAEIERLRENVDRAGKEVERADRLRAEIARVKSDERENRAEIKRLRAALEYMVNVCPAIDPDGDRAHEQARKALEGKP